MFCYGLRLLAEKISSLYLAHDGYVKNKEALTRNIEALLYRIQFCEICCAYEPEVYCYSRYSEIEFHIRSERQVTSYTNISVCLYNDCGLTIVYQTYAITLNCSNNRLRNVWEYLYKKVHRA